MMSGQCPVAGKRPDDLAMVTALTLIAVALVVAPLPIPLLRVVVGLPFAVVVPGYAVTAAASGCAPLRRMEWVLGSVAGSTIIATLGGFVLNWTPWGLTSLTWAILLGTVTLVAVGVARRRRGPATALVAPFAAPRGFARVTPLQGALFGLAALVFAGAVGVAYLGAVRAPTTKFTQFWLLPGESGQVRIGIHNEEATPVTYILRVRADGTLVQEWKTLTLQPGKTWETALSLSPGQGEAQTIEALLYRANADGLVYRRATLER